MSSPSASSSSMSPAGDLCLPRTTIIISNLNKNDFIVDEAATTTFCGKKLSLADQIKLVILNLKNPGNKSQEDEDYYLNHIDYWTNLPFLNRIIIIFKDEQSAHAVYRFLSSTSSDSLTLLFPYVKVSQKENLLSRSKSFDSLIKTSENLSVSKNLTNFKNLHNGASYNEPEPKPFNVFEDLSKIGIDLNQYNDEDQIDELNKSPASSLSLGVKRTRSLTKTLFKPDLKVDTSSIQKPQKRDYPPSPTITLDESM